jgi:hypothetical protein
MNTASLNLSFAELVKNAAGEHPWILSNYDKVKGVLKDYAARRELTLAKLTLLHLCNDRNRTALNSSLNAFIDKLPKSRSYKSELKSRLRRILKALSAAPDREATTLEPTPLPIPEILHKLLPALPRQGYCPGSVMKSMSCTAGDRLLARPLTDRGQQTLAVLIQVVEEYEITDLDTLFFKHRAELWRTIRLMLPPRVWKSVRVCLSTAFKRLGYSACPAPKQHLDYHEWPPTLRKQFDRLKEFAPYGIDHDLELTKQAIKYEVDVVPLKKSTLKNYELALSAGLFHILSRLNNKPADIDVRDLLRLQKAPSKETGARDSRKVNPLVEHYHRRELERTSKPTASSICTGAFSLFINAVRVVALYNGYFELNSKFMKVYRLKIDKKERRAKKIAKKDTFDLAWIDTEIARMLTEFRRIVKERSFRFESKTKISLPHERYRDMRFCLFFVILVTLRYMGHRQQSLRSCEIGRGKNVEFLADGSIHFNWKSELVKTDVELDQIIEEWEHQTHEIMREVLTTYYWMIYRPYILKHSATGPNGQILVANQLFVYIDRAGQFRRFTADDERKFGARFKEWSFEFMEYGGRANLIVQGLHPHYFRGLAADWMVNEYKVPLEKAAEYFGITATTLVKEYLRVNPKKSAADALEAANAAHHAKAAKENEEAFTKQLRDNEATHKEEMARKDKLLEEKDRRIYELQEQLISVLKKNAA